MKVKPEKQDLWDTLDDCVKQIWRLSAVNGVMIIVSDGSGIFEAQGHGNADDIDYQFLNHVLDRLQDDYEKWYIDNAKDEIYAEPDPTKWYGYEGAGIGVHRFNKTKSLCGLLKWFPGRVNPDSITEWDPGFEVHDPRDTNPNYYFCRLCQRTIIKENRAKQKH